MAKRAPVYKELSPLAGLVSAFIWIQMAVSAASLWSDALEYKLRTSTPLAWSGLEPVSQEAIANDARQGIVAMGLGVVMLITAVLVLSWIYRADKNLHARRVPGLEFKPGWCVGWFFVPIACLYKPYQAMKEIWTTSMDPVSLSAERTALLPLWWTLYLASNVTGHLSARTSFWLAGTSQVVSNELSMASTALSIPEALILLILIRQITRAQPAIRQVEEREPEGFF